LSIKCGSQIIAFIIGFINPDYAQNMYEVNGDWFKIKEQGIWVYICVMSAIIVISAFKANIWFMLIGLLSRLNLESPFSMDVAKRLEGIAYQLLVVWLAGSIVNSYFERYENYDLDTFTGIDSANEFLFVAGVVYVISQIFKRGIEMQEENELTV